MITKQIIKQGLLRFGGYSIAKKIDIRRQNYALKKRFKNFIKTGNTLLPDRVMLEPTQRCNLRCKMCFQDRTVLAKQAELTKEQIIDFFDHTPYLQKATLIGGEIFIRKDMIDLIRYLDRTRDLVISTNATLLADNEIDLLRACRNIIAVCISLDGPKEIHESIRGVPGSYDKTAHTIKALAPIFPVTVTCVIQNDNLGILPTVVDLCADMGVKKVRFEFERLYLEEGIFQTKIETTLESYDMPISSSDRMRSYDLETLQRVINTCRQQATKMGIHIEFDPPYLLEEIEGCYHGTLRSNKKCMCQSFRMATIAPNGDLINCFAIRKSFGNILDAPFNEIWNSKAAISYRKELVRNNLTPLCENCPFLVVLD